MAGRTPRQIEILEAASDESEEASSGSEAADEEPGTAGGAGAAGQGGASAAAAPAAGGGRARRDEAKRGESGVRPKRPPTARARCQMQRPLGRPAHLHFSLAPSQRLFSHRLHSGLIRKCCPVLTGAATRRRGEHGRGRAARQRRQAQALRAGAARAARRRAQRQTPGAPMCGLPRRPSSGVLPVWRVCAPSCIMDLVFIRLCPCRTLRAP